MAPSATTELDPLVRVGDINKSYDEVRAMHGVSLEVGRGEVFDARQLAPVTAHHAG